MTQMNSYFDLATRIINHTGRHLFLTGRAGTGKTTFLKHIQETTPNKAVVVAPTGVAALNAGGVTMHSFFQLPLGMYLPDAGTFTGEEWNNQLVVNRRSLIQNIRFNQDKRALLRELELLIIDEVSMLRADALDAIDAILRYIRDKPALPFGGVQVLFIGDLFQLPPVLRLEEASLFFEHYLSPFFFSARVIQEAPPLVVELKHIFRQSDERFIAVLNAIRENRVQEEDLALLHEQYKPWQEPMEGSVLLTTHNAKADRINTQRLEQLPGKEFGFEAVIERDFSEHALPVERVLRLKVGAQIMFIKNDTARRFYNGKLAQIFHIGDEDDIWVRLEGSQEELKLELHTWRNIRYKYDREKDKVEEQELGSFSQYPIRLAWAITIHKSQGLTFERATVDAGASFAAGQVYVALSRLRSLDGLVLHSRIPAQGIEMSELVIDFCSQQLDEGRLEAIVRQEEEHYAQQKLIGWFSFEKLSDSWALFHQGYEQRRIESLEQARTWSLNSHTQILELERTAQRFRTQLTSLLGPGCNYALINDRVEAAVTWMTRQFQLQVMQPLQLHFETWRKKARSKKYLQELRMLEALCLHLLKGWRQARQLSAGLAGGISSSEIEMDNTTQGAVIAQMPKAGKPKKGDSSKISLAMYQEGKCMEEIAAERGLAGSTIEGHLLQLIPSGEVALSVFVNPQKQKIIEEAIAAMKPDTSITELLEVLGSEFSYRMIQAVQTHLESQKTGQGLKAI